MAGRIIVVAGVRARQAHLNQAGKGPTLDVVLRRHALFIFPYHTRSPSANHLVTKASIESCFALESFPFKVVFIKKQIAKLNKIKWRCFLGVPL